MEVEESEMRNEEEAKSTGCKLVRVSCCLPSWLKSYRSRISAQTLASAYRHSWMAKTSKDWAEPSTPTARYPISCQHQSFTRDLVIDANDSSDLMTK